jgi:hypothetical protein
VTLAIVLMPNGVEALQTLCAGLASVVRRERFDLLEQLSMLGVTRIVFPSCEYQSKTACGRGERRLYDTVRLFPRGDDGGFADAFLKASLDARHTGDT